MPKAKLFDAAEYLDSPEMIAAYLEEAVGLDDQTLVETILKTAIRAIRTPASVNSRANIPR